MKTCSKCGIEKDESEFSKHSKQKDGLQGKCKECNKEYQKQHYLDNKKKILEIKKATKESKRYIIKDGVKYKICTQCKEAKEFSEFYRRVDINNGYRNDCKECRNELNKEYHKMHREELNKKSRQYSKENRESINEYFKEKYKYDIKFALASRLRNRLRLALKRNSKKGSAVRDLGCTMEEFKLYIENQFHPGMSWESYGIDWEIDHIVPFKDINVLDEQQLKLVLSYTNLRPCWKWANLARNSRSDNQIDFTSPTPKYFEN